jgi:hypothetical protein
MTPLFPPIGCSYSRYMYPHKILWDAWLEAGPNLLAEKHNWLQLMLVQRPNIRPWYCAVGNFDFPTDLLCKKSTKCCPRNFLQIFPVRTLWQTQWAWRCTTGRWSLGRLPGAQVDPSWSELINCTNCARLSRWIFVDHRGCSSVHHNQVAERPESQLSRPRAMPFHAVPETSWSTIFHPLQQTHFSTSFKPTGEMLRKSVSPSGWLWTYSLLSCDPDPKCLLLFEFDRLRAPMTGVWSWFQYKPNLAWDEMWFNSTSDSAKICWMRNIKPSWGTQPSSAHF